MKIYLVRHGQTQWAQGRGRHRNSAGLSPLGHLQAQHLGQWFADGAHLAGDAVLTVGSVMTSPLTQAHETAQYLGGALGLPVQVQHTLDKAAFSVAAELPRGAAPFKGRRSRLRSERYLDFRAQAGTALKELARRTEETGRPVLAVTHRDVISAVIHIVADSDAFRLELYHGAVNAIEWADGRWQLAHLNLWDHLPVPLRTT